MGNYMEMIDLYEFALSIDAPTYGRSLIIGAFVYVSYVMGKGEVDNDNTRKKSGAKKSRLEDRFPL